MTLSSDGHFAATGCVRSTGFDKKKNESAKTTYNAVIHIWSTALNGAYAQNDDDPYGDNQSNLKDAINGYIMTIGNGFFDRAVSSIVFSKDMSYVCGVGADDNHHMGIWALTGLYSDTGAQPSAMLVAECNSMHGLPRELKWVGWSDGLHYTSYISKEHSGSVCDVLCTAGRLL